MYVILSSFFSRANAITHIHSEDGTSIIFVKIKTNNNKNYLEFKNENNIKSTSEYIRISTYF